MTITVGCEPPTSTPQPRADWVADVTAFEKLYPYITIKSDDANPCDNPTTFNAQLASGKMDNVFYTYFTDADNVISSGQSADIQQYASQINNYSSIQTSLLNVYRQGDTASGDLYGIPTGNYSLGLVYNKTLFKQAGLNPNDPPTTWAQVEQDAIAITKLGHGIHRLRRLQRATTPAAGTSSPSSTRAAAPRSPPTGSRRTSTTPPARRCSTTCTRCASSTT